MILTHSTGGHTTWMSRPGEEGYVIFKMSHSLQVYMYISTVQVSDLHST